MKEGILFWGISILFLGILIIWFVRFFGEMGCNCEKYRLTRWCLNQRKYEGEPFTGREILPVFGKALAFRLAIYLLGVFICVRYIDFYAMQEQFTFETFLESWKRWDARHYISLAELGYADYVEDGKHLFLVFFPLYPWILRIFHLFISDWRLTCLVVSTLSYCVGSVFFYGAVKEEYGGEIARRSLLFINCFPFSFFFGGMMTESLFFCLLAAGFFYIRRHRWFAAGVIGFLASLCRIQGVLLLGVGMVEFLVEIKLVEKIRQKQFGAFLKAFFTRGIWLFLIPVGNLVYFAINQRVEGEPFRFRYYQKEHWYHTTTYIANSISEIYSYVQTAERNMRIAIWLPEFVIFLLAMFCIVYSLRRHPLRYSAFLIVYTVVSYSVTFLISGSRYMLCALPMFVILAEWTRKYRWMYSLLLIASVCLLGVYLGLYMAGWQVM